MLTNIRLNLMRLKSPESQSGSTEAGLHFVHDEQPILCSNQLGRFAYVLPRILYAAADALNAFDDHAGQFADRHLRVDHLLQITQILSGRSATYAEIGRQAFGGWWRWATAVAIGIGRRRWLAFHRQATIDRTESTAIRVGIGHQMKRLAGGHIVAPRIQTDCSEAAWRHTVISILKWQKGVRTGVRSSQQNGQLRRLRSWM